MPMLSIVTRGRSRWRSVKPPMRRPAGVKIWMRSRLSGASATTNVPFGATANAVGSMIRPASAPICTTFHGRRPLGVDAVHRVAPAIEHEVLARGGLLESGRVPETAADLGGQRADRADDLGLERREGGRHHEASEDGDDGRWMIADRHVIASSPTPQSTRPRR